MIGGELVSEGGYGCIFRPEINCSGKTVEDSKHISKIQVYDKSAKKGCLEIDYLGKDLSCYSLTVDYQEDLNSCLKLLRNIDKRIEDLNLIDILANLKYIKKIDKNKTFKMPYGSEMKYSDYLDMQWNQGFNIVKKFTIK